MADRFSRCRQVTIATTLLVGTVLLAATLRVPRGSRWFIVLGLLLAATWIGGAYLAGQCPIVPGPGPWRAITVVAAAALGVVAFVGFLVAFIVGRHLSVVSGALHDVLGKADAGPSAIVVALAVVTGTAEELFFRGALYSAVGAHRPVLVTTAIYVAVTAATGNIALVVAATVMGAIFGLERAATRNVAGSIVTHAVWSTLMLLALPR